MTQNTTHKKSSNKLALLSGVLAAQVVLGGVLIWQNNQQSNITKAPLMASIDAATIDRLSIQADEQSVQLTKKGSDWFVQDELPVRANAVSELVEKISDIEVVWPVASSNSAHKRFEVAENQFNKRVEFFKGDKAVGDLYIGSSPSYRQVHVRNGNDDDVYAVQFDAYQLANTTDAWLDNTLLQPKADIKTVTYADVTIKESGGKWVLDAPQSGSGADTPLAPLAEDEDAGAEATAQATEKSEQQTFIEALNKLVVLGVEEDKSVFDAPEAAGDTDAEGAITRLSFDVATNEKSLAFELISKDSDHYIKRSDYNTVFRLSKSQFDALSAIQTMGQQEESDQVSQQSPELSGL